MTDAQFRDEEKSKMQDLRKVRISEVEPGGYLENLRADFASMAASKEIEANDLEDRMKVLRAEAAGLRHAASGVQEALDTYSREMARAKEHAHARDNGEDAPAYENSAVRAQGRW